MPIELTQAEEKFLEQITADNERGGQVFFQSWKRQTSSRLFAVKMYRCLTLQQMNQLILEIKEFHEQTKDQNSELENSYQELCIHRLTCLRDMGVFTPVNRRRKHKKDSKQPQQKSFFFRTCLQWVSEALRLSSPQTALKQDKMESSSINHSSTSVALKKEQTKVSETLKFNKDNKNFMKYTEEQQDLIESLMKNIQI